MKQRLDISLSASFFKDELASTIEHAVKGAVEIVVLEITKLVGGKFADFRIQLAEKEQENENLRLRLEISENELKAARQHKERSTPGNHSSRSSNSRDGALALQPFSEQNPKLSPAETTVSVFSDEVDADSAGVDETICLDSPVSSPSGFGRSTEKEFQEGKVSDFEDLTDSNQELDIRVQDSEQIVAACIDEWGRAIKGTGGGGGSPTQQTLNLSSLCIPGDVSNRHCQRNLNQITELSTYNDELTANQSKETECNQIKKEFLNPESIPSDTKPQKLEPMCIKEEASDLETVHIKKELLDLEPPFTGMSSAIQNGNSSITCLQSPSMENTYHHIRERTEEDPSSALMIDNMIPSTSSGTLTSEEKDIQNTTSFYNASSRIERRRKVCLKNGQEHFVRKLKTRSADINSPFQSTMKVPLSFMTSSNAHVPYVNSSEIPASLNDLQLNADIGRDFHLLSTGKPNQRMHSDEKLYCCLECGKTFSHSGTFKQHQRIHTGEKPFRCSDCGKYFRHSGTCKRHQRIHTGETPYSCTTCGKMFRDSGTYKRHLRIHTGEMPYFCMECGTGFRSPGALAVHQRTHSGENVMLQTVANSY
ncbi:zinc finger protein 329-like isoform X1 [Erpetoichthys calabaricus]|uniref:Zinc finger protein 3-like n=1 Tax=Erpetoichthys calabaricus TaxID=27687 RepID=A0A8C4RRA0_ERPCA|nr:zinc finger protein 329-like isoform X1 [Erpetoichthys calabaricus]